MNSGKSSEHFSTEDGRQGRRVVSEHGNGNGEETRVVEIFVEPVKELKLLERVVEKKKPLVYERVVEKVDEHGNVIEQRTESIDPAEKLRVVDHIATDSKCGNKVAAQSVPSEPAERPLSRSEVADIVAAAVRAARGEDEPKKMAAPEPVEPRHLEMKNARMLGKGEALRSLGLLDQVEARQEPGKNAYSVLDYVCMAVIGSGVLVAGYLILT